MDGTIWMYVHWTQFTEVTICTIHTTHIGATGIDRGQR